MGVDAAEELDDGDMHEVVVEEAEEENPRSRTTQSTTPAKVSKKKLSPLIGKDLYNIGREKFAKTDIVTIRAEADQRREKKVQVRACILQSIVESICGAIFRRPDHVSNIPSWQQIVRSTANNLGLK